jgi:hypothetical protein
MQNCARANRFGVLRQGGVVSRKVLGRTEYFLVAGKIHEITGARPDCWPERGRGLCDAEGSAGIFEQTIRPAFCQIRSSAKVQIRSSAKVLIRALVIAANDVLIPPDQQQGKHPQ